MKSYSSREVLKMLLADGCMKSDVMVIITSSSIRLKKEESH